MKTNKINKIFLIVLSAFQLIYLLIEVKKDVFICRSDCSQIDIAERMSYSNIQGIVSRVMLIIGVCILIYALINLKNKTIVMNNLVVFCSLLIFTYGTTIIFNLYIGNAFQSILFLLPLSILCVLYLIIRKLFVK